MIQLKSQPSPFNLFIFYHLLLYLQGYYGCFTNTIVIVTIAVNVAFWTIADIEMGFGEI